MYICYNPNTADSSLFFSKMGGLRVRDRDRDRDGVRVSSPFNLQCSVEGFGSPWGEPPGEVRKAPA